MKKISPYYKAIAGGLFGAVSLYLKVADNGVTVNEWLQVVVAALVGSGLVYVVPNKDPRGRHQAESVQPPNQGGYGAIELLVAVVLILVIVWLVLALAGGR